MPVLIFIDQFEQQIKKASFEALTYGADLAAATGTQAVGVILGSTTASLADLGKYGVSKVLHVQDDKLNHFDAQLYATVLAQVAEQQGADVMVFSNNMNGKAIAPYLSVKLKAGLASGAVAIPDTSGGFVVKTSVFSGKAFANVAVNSARKIITVNPNAYKTEEKGGSASVETVSVSVPDARLKVTSSETVKGEIPLTEAELVVSAGRGLKGPENWGMIEEFAHLIGAATACSRPVSDSGWRPHHEHVGQTGLAIAPNLYIAIGISGAIQHLAGVNRSKTIVVINKDPEAPFFKAADYGIVGDAFEVVPKLIEAVKKLKK
jgi:electron transfer flavoprotein alpha subunit